MERITVDGMPMTIEYAREDDVRVSEKEALAYVSRAREKYPNDVLEYVNLSVDGEEVGISYGLAPVPFDRIRRITGYLVGTLDRFNDAKRAEEHDRVKHSVSCDC